MHRLHYRVGTARTLTQRTTDARPATASAPVRCAALQSYLRRRRVAQPPPSCSSRSVPAWRRHQCSGARHQKGMHILTVYACAGPRPAFLSEILDYVCVAGMALQSAVQERRTRISRAGLADGNPAGSALSCLRCAATRRPPARRRTGSASTSAAKRSVGTAAPPPRTTTRPPARSTAGEPAADRTSRDLHPHIVAVSGCAGQLQLLACVSHPRAGTSRSRGHSSRI